ncbi:MAG: Crp/Fnr family transcriptional regulator [Parasporobacterium sp.]|nr:Crp/Fnr family transcriptional regulator [Parasporobacterium sp.]
MDTCIDNIDSGIMICEYNPGELVISPLQQSKDLLFLLEGEASVYVLDEEGSMLVAARETAGVMIGDPELFLKNYQSVYVEAKTKLRVLKFPYELCLSQIRTNETFTHFLIRQILIRENRKRQIDHTVKSNKEKILFFIQNMCQNQCITSISKVADSIHCSYRQVQRLIREMVDEGILVRTGKGKYSLTK